MQMASLWPLAGSVRGNTWRMTTMTSVRTRKDVKLWWAAACAALIVVLAAVVASAPRPTLAQSTNSSQEAVVAPNENLIVEGVPPIPQSLAEQADRYTNFRSAFFASWHPTKREMLISTRFANTFQIHQVKMPAGARTQLTFYVYGVRRAVYQPKRRGVVVFS